MKYAKLVSVATLLLLTGTASAAIYKYVNPSTGDVEYTHQPKAGSVPLSQGDTIRHLNEHSSSQQRRLPSKNESNPVADAASSYVEVAELAGATYSVNTRAFSGGAALGVWIMANWATTQSLSAPPPPRRSIGPFGSQDDDAGWKAAIAYAKGTPEYRSSLTLYRFNCGGRTVFTQDVIFHAQKFAQGEIVGRTRGSDGTENVVPGTLIETLLDKSCGLARQRGILVF